MVIMITETELRSKIIKEAADASQSAVANRLGVSRAYISDIVAGKRRISKAVAGHYGYRPVPIKSPVERQYESTLEK